MKAERSQQTLRTVPFLVVICLISLPTHAKYSGGTGEPNDPYQIATAADLITLGETPEDYDKHFILTADIDLGPRLPGRKIFYSAVIAPDTDLLSEGHRGGGFSGTFAGSNHRITNIVSRDYLGLFGELSSGGHVSDLRLEHVDVAGTGDHVGALAGENWGTILNCTGTGNVSGYWNVGGLVGEHCSGTIIGCSMEVGADGWSRVGGLVGESRGGAIVSCHVSGFARGYQFIGGLVGLNGRTVTDCSATADVLGREHVGGLIGLNYDVVSNSYSTGCSQGDEEIGGLVGDNAGGAITNCYNTGPVFGDESVGGLVGFNGGSISNSYSTGYAVSGDDLVGGLVGDNMSGTVTNSYSVGSIEGEGDNAGGLVGRGGAYASFWSTSLRRYIGDALPTGLSTDQMKDPNTFINAGWDFVGEQRNGISEIWQMPAGGGYPVLSIFNGYTPPEPNGDGSPENPYMIETPEELATLVYRPRACYRLATNIDLSGLMWSAPVVPVFSGRFDGENHRIANLKISGGGSLGLFGRLGRDGMVQNLSVESAKVYGANSWVGVLAGFSNGRISGCYGDGTAEGSTCVGALVGENRGAISNSHSAGSVRGFTDVGGLVGTNLGAILSSFSRVSVTGLDGYGGGLAGSNHEGATVSDSYATGPVNGDEPIGGLVGRNEGTVSDTYSAGPVVGEHYVGPCGLIGSNSFSSRVTSSFWDTETSGQPGSAGGTGKTTAEMQTAKTFLDAGWDFVGETANGTEDIWWIDEGKDYPRLWWEAHD